MDNTATLKEKYHEEEVAMLACRMMRNYDVAYGRPFTAMSADIEFSWHSAIAYIRQAQLRHNAGDTKGMLHNGSVAIGVGYGALARASLAGVEAGLNFVILAFR